MELWEKDQVYRRTNFAVGVENKSMQSADDMHKINKQGEYIIK